MDVKFLSRSNPNWPKPSTVVRPGFGFRIYRYNRIPLTPPFIVLFSKVFKDRHFSCEDCDGTVSGGFDAVSSQVQTMRSGCGCEWLERCSLTVMVFVSQIVLCQNNIHQQAHMNRVVTHELIHAFDHCRAHVDWFDNYKHLACSEVRNSLFSPDVRFFLSGNSCLFFSFHLL